MSEVGVYLGGEGRNELGSRATDPVRQNDDQPGVIATLLRVVQPDGWHVAGAIPWRKIKKYRAGRSPGEERNVLGLVQEAVRANAEVVAFVRDADDNTERPKVIDAAMDKAKQLFPAVDIIGDTAIPVLEGWILAIVGEHGTEKLSKSRAQSRLEQLGVARKETAGMVRVACGASPEGLPQDARRLRRWLATARDVLPRRVQEAELVEGPRPRRDPVDP